MGNLRREDHRNGPIEMIFAAEETAAGEMSRTWPVVFERRITLPPGPALYTTSGSSGSGCVPSRPGNRIPFALVYLSIVFATCDSAVRCLVVDHTPSTGTDIGGNPIKFAGRLVVPTAPRFSAVHGNNRALIDTKLMRCELF